MLQDTFRMTSDQTQRTLLLTKSQRSKVIKEDTLLLIQILDGQTNWTKEESDLKQSRIGSSGTVKTDYLMVRVKFVIPWRENILVLGKMGKEMV